MGVVASRLPGMAGQVPAHVWVRDGAGQSPCLLLRWERRGDQWWGEVAVVSQGEAVVQMIRSDLLRPAATNGAAG